MLAVSPILVGSEELGMITISCASVFPGQTDSALLCVSLSAALINELSLTAF